MQFSAKNRFLGISPFKLRPFADVVRGKNVEQAIRWLSTVTVKRSVPIKKMIESAAANAKDLHNIAMSDLKIVDIRIDHGPMYKYYKPGAMGRSNPYRKRFSHASVVLEPCTKKKD
ncbi:MAG TPA: 50S ribosomal protein L22 [Candidatus Babeliales bacterium]|nr:50S ribosomal protein L22 [Candidatus Babeliales bacterium]